ncbi:hypothetical protein VNI00_019399 [Paramarasmius palmivorus]|uniref:Uncharacterized protein n=1 Tax=Paramarasmius palmivorus TaxID=297713 RepID=A0AAW0ALX3_9AGAR
MAIFGLADASGDFSANLQHNKEPTEEHLASVDNDAPDPESMFPLWKTGQSKEDYQCVVREHKVWNGVTSYHAAQIARWMKYHHDKNRGIKSKDNPFFKLMAKLTGSTIKEPKRKARAYDLWAKAHPERVEQLFEVRMKELKEAAGEAEGAEDVATGEASKDAASGGELSDGESDNREEANGGQHDNDGQKKKQKAKRKGKKKGKFEMKGSLFNPVVLNVRAETGIVTPSRN